VGHTGRPLDHESCEAGMSDRGREQTVALACLAGAMLCFGAVPVFLRHFIGALDMWCVNAFRYSVGALFWLPAVIVLHRRMRLERLVEPERSPWRDALLPTTVNLVAQVGFAACPYHVPAATIGVLMRVSFLSTILLGFLFVRGESRLARSPGFVLGSALSLGGVVFLFLEGALREGLGSWVGLSLVVGTAVGYSAYAVTVRRCMSGYPLRLSFGIISIYTAAALVVLMLLLGDTSRFRAVDGRTWSLLVLSGFLGITVAHIMYHRGIHALGPVIASAMLLGTPLVTILGAVLFLDESMTPLQIAGAALVLGGGGFLFRAKSHGGGLASDA
jgi:drug/metabolite transporter (DMT)-like permease